MKHLIRVTLAAAVLLSGSGLAKAQDFDGRRDGRHFESHQQYRGEAPRMQEHHAEMDRGWRGGEPMRHGGWEHRGPVEYRGEGYGGPVYVQPEYSGYAVQPDYEDNGPNIAGAVIVGAVAAGLLTTLLLSQH